MPTPASDLASTIRERAAAHARPFIVAIDGRSGSGKSTLASALSTLLDAAIVDGDSFFAGGVSVRSDDPAARADTCIDWQRQRAVIETLLSGRAASYLPFDWDAFDGSLKATPAVIEPRRVLIVEGVYSARPELADLLDLRVLVDATSTVRRQRLSAREGTIGPWELQWHEAENWYFDQVLPREWFDLVVSG